MVIFMGPTPGYSVKRCVMCNIPVNSSGEPAYPCDNLNRVYIDEHRRVKGALICSHSQTNLAVLLPEDLMLELHDRAFALATSAVKRSGILVS